MGARSAVIHCNTALAHQVRLAAALAAGFKAHGLRCLVTQDRCAPGDAHVVLGPHYALDLWRAHPRCLHIDRAFWGDPDCVSVGWHQPDGSRVFPLSYDERERPALAPARYGRDAIALADYRDTGEAMAALVRPHVDTVTVRRHPVEGGSGSLSEALDGKHIAIGRMTTALIDAAIAGLAVVCLDRRNPVMPVASSTIREIKHADRDPWLRRIAWGNWSHNEIEIGEMWECLTTRCDS